MIWGAVIGIPCNIILANMMNTEAYYNLEPTGIIQPLVYAYGVPALCLFYASAIALLYQGAGLEKIIECFCTGWADGFNKLPDAIPDLCFIFMRYGLALFAA